MSQHLADILTFLEGAKKWRSGANAQPGDIIPPKLVDGSLPQPTGAPSGGVALSDAPTVRPRLVNPPPPAPQLATPALGSTDQVQLDPAQPSAGVAPVLTRPLPQTLGQMAGVDESGATMQRPRVAVPLTYHANRLSQMESEPKAVDHNGTVRSALIGLGRGALAGFQRGGLGGALFGAAAGGIQGGFNPAADEQYQQKRDIAHEQATFADIYGRTKGQSDLQNDETKRQLELASAYDKLHPKPTYRPLTTDKGIVFYDQSDPTARIDSGLKLPAKPEPYHAPILRDRTLPDGSKQTEKFNETTGQFEPVKSGDKPFISAPKPTSVGSDGLTPYQRAELRLRQQGITYQHNRDAAADTRSQRSYIEGVHKDFTSRVQQARGLVSQFEYNKARAASESDPAKRQQAVDGMNSAYQALQSYDDVYELGAGGGSPYVKPREGRSVSQVIRANPKLTPEQAVQMILDQHYVPTR